MTSTVSAGRGLAALALLGALLGAGTPCAVAEERSPRELMDVARALDVASRHFQSIVGTEGTEGLRYLPDPIGRAEAGFDEQEIAHTVEEARRARQPSG